MAIVISNEVKKEVLEVLEELEQDKLEEAMEEFEQAMAAEEDMKNYGYGNGDYCPECGDPDYVDGTTCLVCGFPHELDRDFAIGSVWDDNEWYEW